VRNESNYTEIWPGLQELQRRFEMKKVMICLLALTFVMSITAFAQQDTMSQSPSDKTAAAAPLKTLKGTVKVESDKVTFVSDKDQKSWDVMNPEELKAHDGHHVQLSAHVYADKNAIHVMNVKMLKGEKSETMTK
jgi:biopolymer transport protein ExbD